MAEVTGSNPVAPTTPRGASLLTMDHDCRFQLEHLRRKLFPSKILKNRLILNNAVERTFLHTVLCLQQKSQGGRLEGSHRINCYTLLIQYP